jgi:hypothetical protein
MVPTFRPIKPTFISGRKKKGISDLVETPGTQDGTATVAMGGKGARGRGRRGRGRGSVLKQGSVDVALPIPSVLTPGSYSLLNLLVGFVYVKP